MSDATDDIFLALEGDDAPPSDHGASSSHPGNLVDDLFELANNAAEEPLAENNIGDLFDCVDKHSSSSSKSKPKAIFPHRGEALARHMRKAKKHYADMGKLTKHLELTTGQMGEHNRKRAVRIPDLMHADCQKKPKLHRGDNRKWLPAAMMRVCWGYGVRLAKVIWSPGQLVAKTFSPLMQSLRSLAHHYECSHSHMQKVRNCVALAYIQHQNASVKASTPSKHAILRVSFDETEQDLALGDDCVKGVVNVLMMHAKLLLGFQECSPKVFNLVMAPAALINTTAEAQFTGLRCRLPSSLASLDCETVVILNSDSAKSCKRVGRCLAKHVTEKRPLRLGPEVADSDPQLAMRISYVIQTFCMMHMLSVCITLMLKISGQLTPMFCATLFLHSANNMKLLKRRLKEWIRTHLTPDKIIYELKA